MAIVKETVVDQIEATVSRVIQIRFKKQVVEDGIVLASEYHRTTLEPGTPLNSQLAQVNIHLAAMGWPAVAAADAERVRAIAQVEHTPAVIAEYRARRQAQRLPA